MELLLNFIVWIRFFSWDQCCFNTRLIKAVMEIWSPQTFLDKHLALERGSRPSGPCQRLRPTPAPALLLKPQDPDPQKRASKILMFTPSGGSIVAHRGSGQDPVDRKTLLTVLRAPSAPGQSTSVVTEPQKAGDNSSAHSVAFSPSVCVCASF